MRVLFPLGVEKMKDEVAAYLKNKMILSGRHFKGFELFDSKSAPNKLIFVAVKGIHTCGVTFDTQDINFCKKQQIK